MKLNLHIKQNRGFSLIEVLVSLTLFTVVVTVSVGTLLVLIDSNAKSQSQQLVMSNISFALDSMTREIRTGTNYFCDETYNDIKNTDEDDTQDCFGTPGSALAFTEGGESVTAGQSNNRILYYKDGDEIYRQISDDTDTKQAITAGGLIVDDFDIVVTGSDIGLVGDTEPPIVTIFIKGSVVTGDGVSSDFSIQTSVTQQLLDI